MVPRTSASKTAPFGPPRQAKHRLLSWPRACVAVTVGYLHIPSNPIAHPILFFPVHYYLHGRNGDFALQAPLVLGHEAAGVVTAVGPGVKNLVVGQRVAIEAGIMCNKCDYCAAGRYNLCKEMRFCSSAKTFPHTDGTLQTYMNHPAHVLHP